MAVTTEIYPLIAGWTSTDFFDALEAAFVDAGYCAAQYDRYSVSGFEHMVIEVVYDATKTYGKRYYRFMLNGGVLWASICNFWNATTHAPTGTVYVDHTNVSNTQTYPWWRLVRASSVSSGYIKRYTSGARSTFSAFQVVTGSGHLAFTVPGPAEARQSWVDLSKFSFGQIHAFNTRVNQNDGRGEAFLQMNVMVRRDINAGPALNTTESFYYNQQPSQANYSYAFNGGQSSWQVGDNYSAQGNANSDLTEPSAVVNPPGVITLPTAVPAMNPSFATARFPIFAGLAWSAYMVDPLPADFGAYGSNAIAPSVGDDLIVTAGVEEWEVITRRNNPNWGDGNRMNVGWAARLV